MVVGDADISLTITGNGDVLEPHDGLIGKHIVSRCCLIVAYLKPRKLICKEKAILPSN